MDVLSDAVTATRVGKPSASRARVTAPWRFRFAPYDGAGFHIVLQGSCLLWSEETDPVPLGAGDVVFLPYGSAHLLADAAADPRAGRPAVPFEEWARTADGGPADHAAEPDSPGTTVLLCGTYRLSHARAHPLLAELPAVVHLPARVGSDPELRAAVDLLGRETGGARSGGDAAVPALLDLLLVYILRAWLKQEATAGRAAGWSRALTDPAVAAALRAMHDHPARPWTLQTLAARAGVSRSSLARRFTALVGRPPMDYLTWWRMGMAARLLRDPDTPLAAVARAVGYASPFAFAHAFKREFGDAPGRYRASVTGRPVGSSE